MRLGYSYSLPPPSNTHILGFVNRFSQSLKIISCRDSCILEHVPEKVCISNVILEEGEREGGREFERGRGSERKGKQRRGKGRERKRKKGRKMEVEGGER